MVPLIGVTTGDVVVGGVGDGVGVCGGAGVVAGGAIVAEGVERFAPPHPEIALRAKRKIVQEMIFIDCRAPHAEHTQYCYRQSDSIP